MTFLILLAAAGLAPGAPDAGNPKLAFASADVARRSVTLGELADLSPLPRRLRTAAAEMVVTSFPRGRSVLRFTAGDLARRIEVLAPALAPWLETADEAPVELRLAPAISAGSAAPTASCLIAGKPVPAGAFVAADQFEGADCPDKPRSALRYDPVGGAVRASRGIDAGEAVLAVPLQAFAGTVPGRRFTIEANVGPVVVRREVEAVRPGRPGTAMFVTAGEGAPFAVPHPELGE